jgi:hypothetical protein
MALVARLECARAILRDRTIVVERADGSTLSFTGADFSYGVGKDIDEAEFRLKRHKAEREGSGEIARGELRGITIKVEKPEPSPPESSHSPAIGSPGCRESSLGNKLTVQLATITSVTPSTHKSQRIKSRRVQ